MTDLPTLDRCAAEIESAFPRPWLRQYSLKANGLPALVRRLARRGWGGNVVSAGEWRLARRAGLPNAAISFEGIGKTDRELEAVARARWTASPCDGCASSRPMGHGIAAIHDPALMDLLAERRIPLEVCPTSNLRTGALALQLHNPGATLQQHPLPQLLRHGIPIVLSTDDPAMFHASLGGEYELAAGMGLCEAELAALHRAGVEHAFLPKEMKQVYLARL